MLINVIERPTMTRDAFDYGQQVTTDHSSNSNPYMGNNPIYETFENNNYTTN